MAFTELGLVTEQELRFHLLAQRLVDDEGILLVEARELIVRFGSNSAVLQRHARVIVERRNVEVARCAQR